MAQGIEYHVRAILEARKGRNAASKLDKWAAGIVRVSQGVENVGNRLIGNTFQTVALWGKLGASIAAAAGAAGLVAMVKQGFAFNAQLEQMQYSMASTLQLMGHAQGDFNKNLQISEVVQNRLFAIAAKSPASFEQASQMFTNMLPGARSVTDNMEDILQLSKESLALGMIMGGDFATTGAQMSRILTGGAGAEFETWKVLQKPILEAGKSLDYFGDNMALGTKLTQEFNRLSPEKRFELVRAATEKLGVATEAFGGTWAGVSSTMMSDLQILKKEMTSATFGALKETFKGLTQTGGVLDPTGETMNKLREAASFLGSKLGMFVSRAVEPMGRWIQDWADNWQDNLTKLFNFIDRFERAVKMVLKAKIASVGVGMGLKGAGMVGKGVGKAIQGIQKVWPVIMQMGAAALWALPAILVLGFALAGVAAIGGAVAAYIIAHWQDIVDAVKSGALAFEPLFYAIDDLWAALVALGNAMFGTSSPAGLLQGVVDFLGKAIYFLMGIMVTGIRVIGAFYFVWKMLIMGAKTVKLGMIAMIMGIVGIMKAAADAIGLDDMSQTLQNGMNSLYRTSKETVMGMKDDAKEATKFFEYANAFENARADPDAGITKGLREGLASWRKEGDKDMDLGTMGGAGGKKPPSGGGRATHIHKMVVHQDLRNQDPDRVIGAFYRAVDRSIEKRTSSLALEEQGV